VEQADQDGRLQRETTANDASWQDDQRHSTENGLGEIFRHQVADDVARLKLTVDDEAVIEPTMVHRVRPGQRADETPTATQQRVQNPVHQIEDDGAHRPQ
jgi:hypothetical protein